MSKPESIKKLLSGVEHSADKSLEAKRQIKVIAASGRADRVGDIVNVQGIDLKNFKKNPVILYGHDHYGLPVAKAVEMGVEDGKLMMVFEFADAETYAFADTVYRLVKGGFLKGVSIGARILEAQWLKDKQDNIIGREFMALELLEVSVVAIPADSKALITAVKSGAVTESEFEEYLEKTFDAPLDSDKGNAVSIDTEVEPDLEDDAVNKEVAEKITGLETRLASLEGMLTKSAEASGEAKSMLDTMLVPLFQKMVGGDKGVKLDMSQMLAMVEGMSKKFK